MEKQESVMDYQTGNVHNTATQKVNRVLSGGVKIVIIMVGMALHLMLSGCATTPSMSTGALVAQGDEVECNFTCRTKNGEVALSTYQAVNDDLSLKKSPIFLARDRSTPVKLTAGKPPADTKSDADRGFEEEVLYQLPGKVVGLPVGTKEVVELNAKARPGQSKDEWFIKIARVRQRARELRFTPEEYEAKAGKKAQVGQVYDVDKTLPGRVTAVSDTEIIVGFAPEKGREISTPFGKGVVRELPQGYEIRIDAQPGTLVRSGGLIGRIAAVDDVAIVVDYSHPFGGDPLTCDVLIESIQPKTSK
ncbi:MAG: hypothetical protein A4E64_01137 [Syntrophorhabdus sp. PtaU1.Bin058]|nr:MAG: hypothetical protein A4E64_01137 [Syntrophorhabdus sp. PtaU1.Bin058]